MPRTMPGSPPPFLPPQGRERLSLALQTVTPFFGGGATTKISDERCPVRSAPFRGLLRYWWRAARGGAFATSEELYRRELAIWGESAREGVVGHSPVALAVTEVSTGSRRRCAEYVKNAQGQYRTMPNFVPGWPKYALFPFQGKASGASIEEQPTEALLNVRFTLTLTFPEALREDVETALATFVTFGGIGSRTRRGCGSLRLVEGRLPAIVRGEGAGVPGLTKLPSHFWSAPNLYDDPIAAWNEAVDLYAFYRQGEGFGRQEGSGNTPGMSNWPEPDAIRRLRRTASRGHEARSSMPTAFPRADFGLPIVFHFKDFGDPEDNALEGPEEGKSRFASPILTKAILGPGGKYRATLVPLMAPSVYHFGPLQLNGPGGSVPVSRPNPPFQVEGLSMRARLQKLAQDDGWTKVAIR